MFGLIFALTCLACLGSGAQPHAHDRRSVLAARNAKNLGDLMELVRSDGWEHVVHSHGVHVWKKFLRPEDESREQVQATKFACVKACAVISAPPADVFRLFLDNSRVHEYNQHCKEVSDLEFMADNTKVTWAATGPLGPFKARDFCTVVHYKELPDGTFLVLNRATHHEHAPRTRKYVRSDILIAGNVLEPVPDNPRKTRITSVTHVNPGGVADNAAAAIVINALCATGPVAFITGLERAARATTEEWRRRHPVGSTNGVYVHEGPSGDRDLRSGFSGVGSHGDYASLALAMAGNAPAYVREWAHKQGQRASNCASNITRAQASVVIRIKDMHARAQSLRFGWPRKALSRNSKTK